MLMIMWEKISQINTGLVEFQVTFIKCLGEILTNSKLKLVIDKLSLNGPDFSSVPSFPGIK